MDDNLTNDIIENKKPRSIEVIEVNGGDIINILQDGDDIYYNINSGGRVLIEAYPIKILRSDITTTTITVNIITDITITNSISDFYFRCDTHHMLFDGNDNTINIQNVIGYKGLIQNGSSDLNDAFDFITVQNIKLIADDTSLLDYIHISSDNYTGSGWICQYYFGYGKTDCVVDNCSSNAIIDTIIVDGESGGCGGIVGGYNHISAINCYSLGNISGNNSGGIFGKYAGYCITAISSTTTATNCYSTGIISGMRSGGIFGYCAGYNEDETSSASVSATNCYSTGLISGAEAGGIYGSLAGYNNGASYAYNCYSIGAITGIACGGIYGTNAVSSFATNCYSLGEISGIEAGGIYGKYCGAYYGIATATNCYSVGNISGSSSGGICGSYSGAFNGTINVSNCYTVGEISGNSVGGIFGIDAGLEGYASASNCYTCGKSTNIPIGGIFPNSSNDNFNIGTQIGINNYSEANNENFGWNYNNAKTPLNIEDPETVWINVYPSKTNVPFLLYGSSDNFYNQNFYTTNETTIRAHKYTQLVKTDVAGNFYWIIPNELNNSSNVSITKNGQMTSKIVDIYTLRIISGNQLSKNVITPTEIYGYNTIDFTLTVNFTISGITNLRDLYSSKRRKKTDKQIRKYINDL
jgi:hypothetical protein